VSEWWVGTGGLSDRAKHSQDCFRGGLRSTSVSTHNTRGMPQARYSICRSPALMYLTCPATHTTKLPSGRPSTNCLRLRSYSEAGIPGVTSPCLTFYARISGAMKKKGRCVAGCDGVVLVGLLTHRGGCGILRWVDRIWTALLVLLGDDAGVLELG
jgi:hypothetical protein